VSNTFLGQYTSKVPSMSHHQLCVTYVLCNRSTTQTFDQPMRFTHDIKFCHNKTRKQQPKSTRQCQHHIHTEVTLELSGRLWLQTCQDARKGSCLASCRTLNSGLIAKSRPLTALFDKAASMSLLKRHMQMLHQLQGKGCPRQLP